MKSEKKFLINISFRKSRIVLFLAIFQTLGIRLFDGIGVLISILIFILLIGGVKFKSSALFKVIGFSVVLSGVLFCKGVEIAYVINTFLLINNSFLLWCHYNKCVNTFYEDVVFVLHVFFYQSLLSLLVWFLLPHSLLRPYTFGGTIPLNHFLYLFYYPANTTEYFLGIFPRLMGWAWEPGCLQLLLNILLFLNIKDRKPFIHSITIIFAILFTGSTTGYIILFCNFILYFLKNKNTGIIKTTLILTLFALFLIPVLYSNISSKLSILGNETQVSSSGAIRVRDFIVGLSCIVKHPILGLNVSNLAKDPNYVSLEYDAISFLYKSPDLWYSSFDICAGGYCNGFLSVYLMYGILSIPLYIGFFKSRLWTINGKKFLMIPLIISLSMISEPISNTVLFYFIALYNFYFRVSSRKNINISIGKF